MQQKNNLPMTAPSILSVNNIEVIYDHVILVLKGVSLSVPRGKIVALMGGYTATAMVLHTFDQQLPPGKPSLLPERK